MKKDEMQLRVARLLDGSCNVENLNRIFNWLRSRSHGETTIKEIGDFAAHQDRRDQGMTWRRAKELFHNAQLFVGAHNQPFAINRSDYRQAYQSSLALVGPETIRREMRIGMKSAKRLLESALQKSETVNRSIYAPWTPAEERLMDYLGRRFTARPIFDQDGLISSLTTVLVKEKLLDLKDAPRLAAQGGFVSMYVLSIMHLCEIDLGNERTATLEAGIGPDGLLVVASRALVSAEPKIEIGSPLFKTNCHHSEWCHPDCGADFNRVFTWSSPLELDERGRITEMA